jgi:hypothetical protein
MPTDRHPHILNASTNLLGICFVIITGLKLTGSNDKSWADEIAWVAAICFLLSTLLSYLTLRTESLVPRLSRWAERSFIAGVIVLFVSVLVAAAFIEA